jgi:hypothetical protein
MSSTVLGRNDTVAILTKPALEIKGEMSGQSRKIPMTHKIPSDKAFSAGAKCKRPGVLTAGRSFVR